MFVSRAKQLKNALNATKRAQPEEKDQKPKLETFIADRDYTGAATLLEFEKQAGDASDTTLPWLGYCYFHLGDYKKAMDVYQDILDSPMADPSFHLFRACCMLHLGLHKEAQTEALKGPATRLRNRIMLHSACKLGDATQIDEYTATMTDSVEDQLCLAAMNYSRDHWQQATDIYKRLLMDGDRSFLALQVYIALCYYKLDYYDVSLDVLNAYLDKYPDSAVALNLKACNQFKVYDGKAAESELKALIELISSSSQNFENDLVRHNMVVFRDGMNALQVLPGLVDVIPEARLNLVICHLRNGEAQEAFDLIQNFHPSTPPEYILKAVAYASVGQMYTDSMRDGLRTSYLQTASALFKEVGESASEMDTIPGRQCMASLYFLANQFEEVLVYLNSVKAYCYNDPHFNCNFGIALAATGQYKEAEESLMLVTDEKISHEFMYLSWLARCFIMNGKARDAWDLYLKVDSGEETFELLQLIANDCYKVGSFFYSAKAFDVLERLDPTQPEYWEGKRGACCGVLQMVIAGKANIDELREVIKLLQNDTSNPQVQLIIRIMTKWLQAHMER